MIMSRVLGLLILGVLDGVLLQEIQVFQVPEIHATPGSDVTLPCTYNVSGIEVTIGSYKWYRHLVKIGLEVSDSNKDFTGRISRADTDQFIRYRSAPITIHNVDPTDTGMYYCTVSIIDGEEISGSGAGTLLNVTEQTSNRRIISARMVLGSLVLLATLVMCYIHFGIGVKKETDGRPSNSGETNH